MKNKPYPMNTVPQVNNLKELMLYCKETYKNKTAFQFEHNHEIVKINFKELLDDMNGLGTSLYKLGLHDAKIALIGENSYYWILSYFAVVNGGNVIVPLDPETTEYDFMELLISAEISCVICSKKYLCKIQKIRNKLDFQQLFVLEKDILNLILQGKEFIEKGERTFIDYKIQNDKCRDRKSTRLNSSH